MDRRSVLGILVALIAVGNLKCMAGKKKINNWILRGDDL